LLGAEDRSFKKEFFAAPLQGQFFLDHPESPRVIVVS
jgi:hypothetical protein